MMVEKSQFLLILINLLEIKQFFVIFLSIYNLTDNIYRNIWPDDPVTGRPKIYIIYKKLL